MKILFFFPPDELFVESPPPLQTLTPMTFGFKRGLKPMGK